MATRINADADELGNQVAQQVSGTTSARQGTATKGVAREALRDGLERLRRTARAISRTMPGLDSKFRIPRTSTDQELIGTARAFAADALPLQNDFIRFSMPATFIADLNEHIEKFEAALTRQQSSRGAHVMAKVGINDALEDALDAIRQFDAIVPNVFHDDPARLAAWTSARHVERAARKPQTSTATPGSTSTPPAT
ncbi:MAG: hypothetical protein H7Z16_08705 [Pyrinomonadaceae bacterium]|nr:hypothetical protein [Pyrinomonadaceae bacterium]